MGDPLFLRPDQIDHLTLRQIAMYGEENCDEDLSYEEIVDRVNAYRKEQGLPLPK